MYINTNLLMLMVVVDVPVCRQYANKYSGMTGHQVGKLLSNGSGRNKSSLYCICNIFLSLQFFSFLK